MKTKLIFTIALLVVLSSIVKSQEKWKSGVISLKSNEIDCTPLKFGGYSVSVNSKNKQTMNQLPWGISEEKGGAYLYINSERELYKALSAGISKEKAKVMYDSKELFFIKFTVNENGIPVQIEYFIEKKSKLIPNEILVIDDLLMKNIRFKIVRKTPFGEPCVYPYSFTLNYEEFILGELKTVKLNENEGKKYW